MVSFEPSILTRAGKIARDTMSRIPGGVRPQNAPNRRRCSGVASPTTGRGGDRPPCSEPTLGNEKTSVMPPDHPFEAPDA